MRYLLISIKDRAIEAFEPVGTVRAHGEALRVFKDLINNAQTKYHAHAQDYDLYLVGHFDDQTGKLVLEENGPVKIADGKTYKEMGEG